MEWVEVRGETLEAAKEEALDQLGVARDDAEFEIVQEAESRWMGLKKTEARVRARVRPTAPPPKKEGGRGGRGRNRSRGGRDSQRDNNGQSRSPKPQKKSSAKSDGGQKRGGNGGSRPSRDSTESPKAPRPSKPKQENRSSSKKEPAVNDSAPNETVPLEEQQAIVTSFLEGLADGFGLDASVSTSMEEDVIIGSVDGDDLGLMVGPRGGTLRAIQELSRSAVQRKTDGRDTNRLMIDVAGYRERRRAALAEFAQRQAEQVVAEGIELALEPMGSADRKAIHDAIVEIEGVKSISEGDDPNRRIVLLPDS